MLFTAPLRYNIATGGKRLSSAHRTIRLSQKAKVMLARLTVDNIAHGH